MVELSQEQSDAGFETCLWLTTGRPIYEKNIKDRIYRYSSHDGLPVAPAFCDSAEIRKFRHKNHRDRIDTDFPDCIIQPDH